MAWPPDRAFSAHPWQTEAISAWDRAGRRGVVEAATGTGKTYAGLEAIDRLIRVEKRLSTLIVVPTVVLLNQWRDRLQSGWKPAQRVGRIGDGFSEDFRQSPIACVAVINSALSALPGLLEHASRNPAAWRTLLIADECHRYVDAPEWSKLTSRWRFDYILGLTATMPRFAADGLGRIVYEYTFQRAFEDGLVPAFDLFDAEVLLTTGEREQYLKLDREASEQSKAVWVLYGDELSKAPPERFFQVLRAIMMRGARTPEEYDPTIKRYLVLLYKRAAIAYTSRHKLELADALVRALVAEKRRKTIVFFERIESAEAMGEALEENAAGLLRQSLAAPPSNGGPALECSLFHSGMKPDARAAALRRFADGGAGVLLACRALDEGLDIPDVDAAVLVSSTQSQRQRIQRIGRALRRGDGDKRPVIVSLHVRGTGDANTAAEDEHIFGNVATIHRTDAAGALRLVRSLAVGDRSAPLALRRPPPETPPPPGPTMVRPPGV